MKSWLIVLLAVVGVALFSGRVVADGGGCDDTKPCIFIRGDFDGDDDVDWDDSSDLSGYLYYATPEPCNDNYDRADVNDDGVVNGTDSSYLITYLIHGTPAPPAPFAYACIDGYSATNDSLNDECGTNFKLDQVHNLDLKSCDGSQNATPQFLTTFAKVSSGTNYLKWKAEKNNVSCSTEGSGGAGQYHFHQRIDDHDAITYGEIKALSQGNNCDWSVNWTFESKMKVFLTTSCEICDLDMNENWFRVHGKWDIFLQIKIGTNSYYVAPSNTDQQWFVSSGTDQNIKHGAVYFTINNIFAMCDCNDYETPELTALSPRYFWGTGSDGILVEDSQNFETQYSIDYPNDYEACVDYSNHTYVGYGIDSNTINFDIDDIYSALPGSTDDDTEIVIYQVNVGEGGASPGEEIKGIWLQLSLGGSGDKPLYTTHKIEHTLTTETFAIVADGCDND